MSAVELRDLFYARKREFLALGAYTPSNPNFSRMAGLALECANLKSLAVAQAVDGCLCEDTDDGKAAWMIA